MALVGALGAFLAWFVNVTVRSSISDSNAAQTRALENVEKELANQFVRSQQSRLTGSEIEANITALRRDVERLRDELDAEVKYSHIGIELLKVQIHKEYDS
jgi:hypothetical protein